MAASATARIIPSEQPASAVPLSALPRGTRARIIAVSADRGECLARRLVDLGFEPGRQLEVGRRAPLGDPAVYHVADYELSLRRRDAALITVEVISTSAVPGVPEATA
ncbi:FeoA family protein [Actinomyces ruminis]|uniref:Ferrous iron transport protein A n=1 Tax=Actinomyces ruminis TaxID=1937003 RepID=A0ABX4MCX2_9ACTO|nr:FeoA family protein [Actinomyces ruminis]PHP53301.1 ferrous iron transport protein A [Actinomyces ruminis]